MLDTSNFNTEHREMIKPTPPARILVADDDHAVAQAIARVLTQADYHVEVVHAGDEALGRLRTDTFALVILDVSMPGLDGRDVLSHLSRNETPFETPILVITGRYDEYVQETVLGLGARDVLEKPFDVLGLVSRVRALIDEGQPN